MRLLCIGDVVSAEGRQMLARELPRLKREYRPDFIIVNGENAALGNGIDRRSMKEIFDAGADVVSGGNHSLQKAAASDVLEETPFLLRPANFGNTFGRGWCRLEGRKRDLLVINLQGMLYLPENENPFVCADGLLEQVATARDIIAVDFHAEASSEKRAMGFYLDGRVSLVFGTHTHVLTADETVLPEGTGYITDIGMTGVEHSILGKAISPAVHNFVHWGEAEQRQKTQDADGRSILCGILAEIDEQTGRCTHIERICRRGKP